MQQKFFSKVLMASSTAALIAGPVIVCLLIGLWLDGLLDTSPLFGLIFGLLGFVGSILSLIKLLKTIK
jgi:F0F1-type ATP synthase assembly protein I